MSEIEKLNMIAEWQEQHKQLIEDLDNSKKRIVELEERVWRQKKKMVEKTKKIADLEAQIEKMKCDVLSLIKDRMNDDIDQNIIERLVEKWEIKEK